MPGQVGTPRLRTRMYFCLDENFSLTHGICLRTCHFHPFICSVCDFSFYLFVTYGGLFYCDFVLLSLPAGPLSVRCLKQCRSFQTVDLYQALVRPSELDLGSRFQLSFFSHLFGFILKASPPSILRTVV